MFGCSGIPSCYRTRGFIAKATEVTYLPSTCKFFKWFLPLRLSIHFGVGHSVLQMFSNYCRAISLYKGRYLKEDVEMKHGVMAPIIQRCTQDRRCNFARNGVGSVFPGAGRHV
jgi:hypothetical protein